MSGTSYGACILHVAPESYIGGPLSLLKTGDIVEIDVNKRSINMLVDNKTIAKEKIKFSSKKPKAGRGWLWMYSNHVKQANEGCDFDFLETDLEILQKSQIYFKIIIMKMKLKIYIKKLV